MSIPHDSSQPAAQPGWYATGETGPDGAPVERWWDGSVWSAMVRPVGGGTFGPARRGRSTRTKTLIATAAVVVVAAAGVGTYLGLHHTGAPAALASPTPSAGQGGGGNGGLGNGNGTGGLGGGTGTGGLGGSGTGGLGASPSPQPTVSGGSGTTVSDPINSLTIPVPSGWTGTSGSASGEGSWPSLATGTYTCPSALTQQNQQGGSSSSAATTCTSGGVNFSTTTGSSPQSIVDSQIAAYAKGNYGTLSSHSVASQGSISVAGRTGYQITWNVVPDYSGPSGTVQLIALPDPELPGYLAVIDIGVDKSSQAPSLSSVDSQIIADIVDSNAAGA
jgi:hypothetical protein